LDLFLIPLGADPDRQHDPGEHPLRDEEENASHNTDGTNTSASASDSVEMFSARQSMASDENPAPALKPKGNIPVWTSAPEPFIQSNDKEDPDLLPRIRGMFRLLDLISERSSSGIGENAKRPSFYPISDLSFCSQSTRSSSHRNLLPHLSMKSAPAPMLH